MSVQALREVRLYGPLRARFGRSHWLAVDSPAEAVRALASQHPGFREAVLGFTGPGYRVLVGEGARADFRTAETLDLGAGSAGVIRIAPVIHANKRGGLGTLIAGALLFFAAPFAAGYLAGSGYLGAAVTMATTGVTVAKALMLGGLIQLLSPQRRENGSAAKDEASYIFNGAVNVTSPGGAVPLVIGRMVVGSVTVSAGLSTDEAVKATSVNTPPARPADEPVGSVQELYGWA